MAGQFRIVEVRIPTDSRRRLAGTCTRNVLAVGGVDAVADLITRTRRDRHRGWTVTAIDDRKSFTWTNRAPGIKVIAHHSIDATGDRSKATLSLRYEGFLGGLLARMTRSITHRYLALEATGLKARSENPFFRVAS